MVGQILYFKVSKELCELGMFISITRYHHCFCVILKLIKTHVYYLNVACKLKIYLNENGNINRQQCSEGDWV